MLAALLLVLIGSADLARSGRTRRHASVVIASIWAVILLVAATGLGVPWWTLAFPVIGASAWVTTTTPREHRKPPCGFWPVAGLGVALLALLAFDETGRSLSGYVVQWHAQAPAEVLRHVSLQTLVLGMAAAVFLTESSNIVVRASLHRKPPSVVHEQGTAAPVSVPSEPKPQPQPRKRWWRRRAVMAIRASPFTPNETAQQSATGDIDLSAADLRGGRLIGPLERLLIVSLTLAGFYAVVAALIAAKGIVRFPEISRDGPSGSKAEYFLVGSLVSWTVAVALVGMLWISAQN
ncbi:hypothetical protein BH09ACT6_BH09ACT6_18460 [soil metagenome]